MVWLPTPIEPLPLILMKSMLCLGMQAKDTAISAAGILQMAHSSRRPDAEPGQSHCSRGSGWKPAA